MPRRKATPPPSPDMTALNNEIRKFLSLAGLTQSEFAELVGIHEASLSLNLTNPRRRPDPDTLVGYSRAMGRSLWDILLLAGYPLRTPGRPDDATERIVRLLDHEPRLKQALARWEGIAPEWQESVLEIIEAALRRNNAV